MIVDFEILIIVNVAILFTIIAILVQEDRAKVIFSLITAITWMILGLGFVGADPTFPTYALLFLAIGIIFVVETTVISVDMLRQKRWKTEIE